MRRGCRRGMLAGLLVAALAGVASAQANAPRVRATADRTAMWVGDRLTYTVEVVCPRGFDVLADDLAKEKLKLDGLDLVSSDSLVAPGPGGEGATRTFRYVLTSYRVDTAALTIAPFTVRYYATRPGQRLEDTAPAGDVAVPGAVIALRSTLPEAAETYAIRDGRQTVARPAVARLAWPIGLGLAVLSIVPAAIWGGTVLGRRRGRRAVRSARQVRQQERLSLDVVRAMEVESVAGRREAYTHVDGLVREHLRDTWGVPGPSLSVAEIVSALTERSRGVRGKAMPIEAIAAVLTACEGARYAPPDRLPAPESCRATMAQAEQVLTAR